MFVKLRKNQKTLFWDRSHGQITSKKVQLSSAFHRSVADQLQRSVAAMGWREATKRGEMSRHREKQLGNQPAKQQK
jgi:hypothetical protein